MLLFTLMGNNDKDDNDNNETITTRATRATSTRANHSRSDSIHTSHTSNIHLIQCQALAASCKRIAKLPAIAEAKGRSCAQGCDAKWQATRSAVFTYSSTMPAEEEATSLSSSSSAIADRSCIYRSCFLATSSIGAHPIAAMMMGTN